MAGAPNFYQLYAESKGVPAGWKWSGWSTADDDAPDGFLRLKGCVPGPNYTRGPRKGQTNWDESVPGTERVLFINLDELEEFKAEWERTTGLCRDCTESGLVWAGWSRDEGTKWKPCTRCGRKPVEETQGLFALSELA